MTENQRHHECRIYDSDIQQTISFRPAEYDKDLDTLFDWMHQKHIYPFWKLNLPYEDFKQFVKDSVHAQRKRVFIGFMDGKPVCYLITYSVPHDSIHSYYSYQEGDIGMHLLVGPRDYLTKHHGFSLVRAMSYYIFEKFGAERIVGEPDYRNRIVIPILKRMGARDFGILELPTKRANLMIGKREEVYTILENSPIQATWSLPSSPEQEWERLCGEKVSVNDT
ncbi:GNAT family N-acetyltransferase [Pontibacillus yanchengensis]|uniref:Lysine N-acyltransferase MbtK n=1 Tax=Pontibacillus yanchengensis Y32 TaxID=1385514 RepID=A0A0A2T8F4_9BACI|nr:GNAT family N-acetyltransferase [Pontibacillus yanchengensis]KGP72097.1 IucA/IucC protein [Pontibacillus yanchengensis Y32]